MHSVSVGSEESAERESRVWALAEPMRRALYRYVASAPGDVSRDDAAAALSIPRHVAKFHLDRLEAEGLVDVEYRRPEGRGGPGAGRPAKWYRRRDADLAVSVPERHYDLLGEVMAAAIEAASASGVDISPTMNAAAAARGEQVGRDAGNVHDALVGTGYEPRDTEEGIVLDNCPFHQLARRHTDLVCGINLSFLQGILDAVDDAQGYRARLRPCPETCCVVLDKRPAAPAAERAN